MKEKGEGLHVGRVTIYTSAPQLFLLPGPRGRAAVDGEFSEPPGSRGALSKTFHT